MAKPNRGGKKAAYQPPAPPPPQPPQPPQPQPPQPNQPINANAIMKAAQANGTIDLNDYGVTLKDIQQMNDNDLHDILTAMRSQDTPDFLIDNMTQRMVYGLGMNEKPIVEPDAQFVKNAKGQTVLYNTQNDTGNIGGFSLTGKDIQDWNMTGDLTLIQNGYYGEGVYFATSSRGSAGYAKSSTSVMAKARLNPAKAKVVTMRQLQKEYDTWKKQYPRSQRALKAMSIQTKGYGRNSYSQFALLRGYNVIHDTSSDYHIVLDRSALIYSDKTKSNAGHQYSNW